MLCTCRAHRPSVAVAALATPHGIVLNSPSYTEHDGSDERAYLDELEARLFEVEEPGKDIPTSRVGQVVERLQRQQDNPVVRLRQWLVALRHGTLSPEQAIVAESDFQALEREADQRGA